MVEVGVKELKNELSAYLRRVASGEQVRVTVRGKPVADLVPPANSSQNDRIRALIMAGRITPSGGPKPTEPPPLEEGPPVSDLILAEREHDR